MAQLNSALDYGSRGYWFESSQGHKKTQLSYDDCVFFIEILLKTQQVIKIIGNLYDIKLKKTSKLYLLV